MHPARFIAVFAGAACSFALWVALAAQASYFGFFVAAAIVALLYGIVLYGFLQYRMIRQEELRSVLTMAADANAPLAGSVWAYVGDRPHGWFRRFCEGTFVNLIVLGAYWSWHKRRNFDRKIADLAYDLESGVPLSAALRATPGVASAETMLAAAVGESTGDLAKPLKAISKTSIGSVVVETLPRLLYPLLVVFFQVFVIFFLMVVVVPKFEAIFHDFRIRMPYFVVLCVQSGRWLTKLGFPFLMLVALSLLWIVPLLILSPGFRWWLFGVSFIERRFAQGRLLKMLGMLLAAGKTVPQSLDLLAREDYLGRPVQHRLLAVRKAVAAGQPLAEQLTANGLMPQRAVALLHSAEKAQNLPWALQETGETLVRRGCTLLHRISSVAAPIMVVILGMITACVALCMMLPLIELLTRL